MTGSGLAQGSVGPAVERLCGIEALHEEFYVCHAAGYPDPYKPTPNTLAEARVFRDEHRVNASTGKPMDPPPKIMRRLVSDWVGVC